MRARQLIREPGRRIGDQKSGRHRSIFQKSKRVTHPSPLNLSPSRSTADLARHGDVRITWISPGCLWQCNLP
uniref:Uncharacterized protein n=1 Tax=Oryza sativa subsp. japonica TaxID=39947 RepID=Q6Z278_ORYSJ|nr:hypothetical protein [Oryza sativa Japonica Group]